MWTSGKVKSSDKQGVKLWHPKFWGVIKFGQTILQLCLELIPKYACFRIVWKWKSFNCIQLYATPWTGACQAPLSMEFHRQIYWSELPFPPPGDLPNPAIEPRSPTLQEDVLPSEPQGNPRMLYLALQYILIPNVLQLWKLKLRLNNLPYN